MTEEEKKNMSMNLMLTTYTDTDTLPTQEELELVGQLKAQFTEEFESRKAGGRDWPCLFGDLALTRILRGCDCKLDLSTEWFKRFLEHIEEFKVDDLYIRLEKVLNDNPDVPFGCASMLPHAEEIKKYVNEIYHYSKATTKGDLINYFAFCDVDTAGIYRDGLAEKFFLYHQAATLLRMLVLDRQSRAQGRMVKTIWLADLSGASMSTFTQRDKSQQAEYDKHVGKFNETISAEIMRKMYILNGPWWAVRIWKIVSKLIPERFKTKVGVMDGNGLDDPDFVELVGGRAALQQMLASRVGIIGGQVDQPSGEVQVGPSKTFEYIVEVLPGQKVSWTTEVVRGMCDFLMGESDVTFTVIANWFDNDEELERKFEEYGERLKGRTAAEAAEIEAEERAQMSETVVPEESIAVANGQVSGSYVAPRRAMLSLQWSNARSKLRTKSVKYFCAVEDKESAGTS